MTCWIEDGIDQVLEEYTGTGYEVKSFVSDKNTKVEAVQFIIKTAAVKKAEVTAPSDMQEEHLTIWQKFLRLFGL